MRYAMLAVAMLVLVQASASAVRAADKPDPKAVEKAKSTIEKARGLLVKMSEGEDEQTAKVMKAMQARADKDPPKRNELLLAKTIIEKDTDFGGFIDKKVGTAGEFLLRQGFEKYVQKQAGRFLGEKVVVTVFADIFAVINPDAKDAEVAECVVAFLVASNGGKAIFGKWTDNGYKDADLEFAPDEVKSLAKKFRGK